MQKKPIRFIISPKKILINNNTDMHEPTYRKRYRANPHEKGPYVRKVPYSPIPWNPWRACHVTRISTRISTMETRVESHLTHSPSFWLAAAPPCHSTSVTHASFAPHFSLNPGFCLIKPAAKVHPSQPSDAKRLTPRHFGRLLPRKTRLTAHPGPNSPSRTLNEPKSPPTSKQSTISEDYGVSFPQKNENLFGTPQLYIGVLTGKRGPRIAFARS